MRQARRVIGRIAAVAGAAVLAGAPAAAGATDRWFAVPLSVPNAGPAEATPVSWVGAGQRGVYFATGAALSEDDEDTAIDIYRRQGASLAVASGSGTSSIQSAQAVSADGATLVFQTRDALTSDDEDGDGTDLYATTDGVTRLVSRPEPGAPFAFFTLYSPALRVSADGGVVAFATTEGLAADDFDNQFDVYVWDRDSGAARLASTPASAGTANLSAGGMSRDGAYVFMETTAALTGDDTDTATDVYRYDTATGSLELFTPGTTQGFSGANASADGSHVFYRTTEGLDPDDSDGQADVYQYAGGTTTLISAVAGATPGAFAADFQRASADGSIVYFTTAETLDGADTDGGRQDIYKRTADGTVSLVSTGPGETLFEKSPIFSGISPDGEHAFFYTQQDLAEDDDDAGSSDAYQRSGGTTTRISVGEQNDQGINDSSFAGFSNDLTRIFFQSDGALTAADGDEFDDIYGRHDGHTSLVTPTAAEPCTLLPSSRCVPVLQGVAGEGTRAWFTADEDLSALDGDGSVTDVYEARVAVPAMVNTTPAPLTLALGDAPVAIDDALEVSDPYDDVFGASVTIAGGEIGWTDGDGIAGSLDGEGEMLTLTGRATAADYEVVLRSVTYRASEYGSYAAEFSVDNGSGPGPPGVRRVEVPDPTPKPSEQPSEPEQPGEPEEPIEQITPPEDMPGPLPRLRIVDTGGRVAHVRGGRWFRVPGLHFGCPRAVPLGCVAAADVWRLDAGFEPLRVIAAGRLGLAPGGRSDALLVRIGPRTLRRLRAGGRLRLRANVAFRAAGAEPATYVMHFRLMARDG
jgi:hypothetical protein